MKNFKGIRLGYSRESGEVLRYGGPGHLMTVAPTRTGKGRDILIPFLLDWPYSCVVVDPKGELAAVTSEWRQRLGEVIYLDPYRLLAGPEIGMRKAQSSRYSPMARLRADSLEFMAESEKNSEGLVWTDKGDNSRFFTGGARGLCSMAQMGLVAHAEPHDRTLPTVRSVITGAFNGGVDVFGFGKFILEKSTNMPLRQMAARLFVHGAEQSKGLMDVIQTAEEETRFLSDPALAECLSGSDFSFADLKKRVITVYTVLPMKFLEIGGKFSRLIVASALSELLSGGRGVPTVMLIDEFFQLGNLKSIENAMGMAAGFGVQLWPVLQDLSQLKGLYPDTWQTFLSNAAVRMFFGPRDEQTADYISRQSGKTVQRVVSTSISHQDEAEQREHWQKAGNARPYMPRAANVNVSFGSAARALLEPGECRAIDDDEALMWVEPVKSVIRARRGPYWDEPEFRGKFSENPYFKE